MAKIEHTEKSEGDSRRAFARVNPVIYKVDGFAYETHKVTQENYRSLRRRFLPFEYVFDYEDSFFIHEKAVHNIRRGGEVIFARTLGRHPKDVGAVTQDVRIALIDGQEIKLLNIGVRSVLPEFQGRGIGAELGKVGMIIHIPDIVTGMSRTWRIFRAYEKTGFIKETRPIGGPLTSIDQQAFDQKLRPSEREKLDLRTGVYKDILPHAGIRRFIPPPNNIRGNEIYRKMKELGVNPAEGDAIRYAAEVDKEALLAAIAAGYGRDAEIPPSTGLISAIKSLPRAIVAALRLQKYFVT